MSIYARFIACRESHLLQLYWKIVFIDGPEFLFLFNKHTFCQSQLQFQCFLISWPAWCIDGWLNFSCTVLQHYCSERSYLFTALRCLFSKQVHIVSTFRSVDQLDGCLNGLVVAQTLSSLVLQEKHLEMLHIHRPEDQKYFKLFFCSFSPVLTFPWPPCTRCSRRWERSPLCCSCCFSARMCSTCHCAFAQILQSLKSSTTLQCTVTDIRWNVLFCSYIVQ